MKRCLASLLLSTLLSASVLASEENSSASAVQTPANIATSTNAEITPNAPSGVASPTPTPTPMPAPAYAEKLRTDADAVFKGPDFHEISTGKVPVARDWLKKWLTPDKKKQEKPTALPNFPGAAQVLKVLAIIALGLLFLWLLWRGWQWLTPQLQSTPALKQHGRIREAQTLPLTENSALPDSVSQSAAHAWQQGLYAQALSLLYRGAVAALAAQHQLSLPHGATEGEYLRLIRRQGPRDSAQAFSDIVHAWSAQAYAGRHPENFPQLLQSYRQYFEHIAAPAKAGARP